MNSKSNDSKASLSKRSLHLDSELELIKLILDENPEIKRKVSHFYKKHYPQLTPDSVKMKKKT